MRPKSHKGKMNRHGNKWLKMKLRWYARLETASLARSAYWEERAAAFFVTNPPTKEQ